MGGTAHPGEVLAPCIFGRVVNRLGGQEQVAQHVDEIQDRREVGEELLPD